MTTREKNIVRESFAAAAQLAGPLSSLFYGRLFEMEPSIRPMFHGDIQRQGMKLMDMLAALIDHLDDMEAITPALHAMGQRHAGYGVLTSHYRLVEEALLWSLGQALEADFDAELRSAWWKVITDVSRTMQQGAAMIPNDESSDKLIQH